MTSPEKISPQLAFSRFLAVPNENFTTRDGSIYKFSGTHWQVQEPKIFERLAFDWLAKNEPAKASEKTAASCVASAILHIDELGKSATDKNSVLVPVKNGTIRVEKEGIYIKESDKNDNLTFCLACEFQEDAKSPLFFDFLRNSVPDIEVQAFLQEYVGYTLMPDSRHQISAWLLGPGGNGKGTFSEVVAALHGCVASMRIGNGDLSGFNLASMIGASLVLVDETPSRIDEQAIKTLISGDLIKIDRKYRNPVEIRPTAKWIVCGNALPSLSDQSDGFWRRWMIIKFDQKPDSVIPLLAQSIIQPRFSIRADKWG
jgi:putative DNA primase/helicase